MKKIIALFAITLMLVFAVFGQQTTPVAPAQAPAAAKPGKVKTTKPAVVVGTPQAPRSTTIAPTPTTAPPVEPATAPAQTIVAPAPATATPALTTTAPQTIAPAQTMVASGAALLPRMAMTATVQATPTAAAQAPTIAQGSAAQEATAPATTITPALTPRVGTTVSQQTPQPSPRSIPGVAAQSPAPRATGQARIASTPGATITGQQSAVTTTAPPAKEPDFVSEKGFKGKVFEVKYRDPGALLRAVQSLGSGFKGAEMRYSDEFKTITIRDFPENIATIEEALKRLDTPQAPRPDIEFRIQVLIGSATPLQGEEYPSDLKDVLQQLLSSLKYKNYSLMFSALHRTKEGGAGVGNNGVAESKLFNTIAVPSGNQIFYDYNIGQISLDSSTSAGTTVQIGQFGFSLRIPLVMGSGTDPKITYQNVGFRSPVSLREGEKVIVGTTTMGDKGLIVVLTAKVNK